MLSLLAGSRLYVLEDKHMDDTLNETNSFRIEFENHNDVSRIEQDCTLCLRVYTAHSSSPSQARLVSLSIKLGEVRKPKGLFSKRNKDLADGRYSLIISSYKFLHRGRHKYHPIPQKSQPGRHLTPSTPRLGRHISKNSIASGVTSAFNKHFSLP
ncbi:putative 2-oxoglutarate/malate carrier protein [Fusarium oxysporum f. sp. albedinis]|nr:putative 2-oxoglutarate/malate carrier protein [Fusarium oxysporum f. sp. albedinis]